MGSQAGTLHPPPWSAEEDRRLRGWRESGLLLREIEPKMGRSKNAISRRCKELGIEPPAHDVRPRKDRLRTGPKPKATTLPPLASLQVD
jgi:hypothetical protein